MSTLSVLIAARNELFLWNTVDSVLSSSGQDTEVIVVLDGPQIPQCAAQPSCPSRVTVLSTKKAVGQRAAINLAASHSTARFIMKLDGHCLPAPDFDSVLIGAHLQGQVQIPEMRHLHAFDWRCRHCGLLTYQGHQPTHCSKCKYRAHDQQVVWRPVAGKATSCWRFDRQMQFQYWARTAPEPPTAEVMCQPGGCWFVERAQFNGWGGLDEKHGGWGQLGVEVSCKAWLSGGSQVVNRATWHAHMFRPWGFPYPLSNGDVERARQYSRELWLNDRWPGQQRPLSWLVEKFAPVPDWHADALAPQARARREAEVVRA